MVTQSRVFFFFCFLRYTAFIVLYPIGVAPGESKNEKYIIHIDSD